MSSREDATLARLAYREFATPSAAVVARVWDRPTERRAGYVCAVGATLAVLGRKWVPLILRALNEGPLHYNALQSLFPGVAHKVLTQQLRHLERHAVVVRSEQQSSGRRRVCYALSDLGRSLRPVLWTMADWGSRLDARAAAGAGWIAPVWTRGVTRRTRLPVEPSARRRSAPSLS